MRIKFFLGSAVLLAAVVLSGCGAANTVSTAAPAQRTLSVTGTGMVYLTPDVAYINIGVHTEMPTASDAVSANNDQTHQVVTALQNSGVDAKDIRTTNFSIYPNTQYDPQTGKPGTTTYVVDNTVYVTVHQLDKLGDLLDATVQAGANSVNSIQFDVFDKTSAIKQARDQAVKDAQTQAQELASASGVTLGNVQSISFTNNIPQPVMDVYGKGGGGLAAAPAAPVPINTGQLTLSVTVDMTYELK
ncbi:MAG TPA: SIMPL domain-containing protein [Anaerolineales bacterium]|nr:SIMPL domain-containing protein [Anaerolineales bacterium]